jgi:hypothetical protein
MRTVYVVNKGGHDHSDAERFGKIVYLSEGLISRYATTEMYRQFAEILKDSSPDDYILPTGLAIMTSIASSIFGYMHGRLNLLLFKSASTGGRYIERSLILNVLLEKGAQDDKRD